MSRRRLTRGLGALIVGAVLAAPLGAQSVTGQLAGVVADAGGGVVPGATVTITSPATSWTREVRTGPDGQFAFVDLVAGGYDLTVALAGFKTVARNGVVVAATERVTLPPIVLTVGALTETVTVQREVPLVQATSGARSALITRENLDDIALKGRDVIGILALLPGVVDTGSRDAPTWSQLFGLTVNGRSGANLTYDGITNKETGSNNANHAAPSIDSIAEVRVQSANFQAEYGRSSGASVTVVTRSGSRDFRGSAAFYTRDAALNGNEFAREEQCRQGDASTCRPALYDIDTLAWTLGGPVRLPGTRFNRNRNRLFFFWSQEVMARTDPGVLTQRRMPTALERAGDFSQTVDSRGRLVHIRDPQRDGTCNTVTGGPACFPGNVIPPERIDPTGQALLGLFPLPNATDPSGRALYNYVFQPVQDMPRHDQVLRLDWNAGPRTRAYGRVQFGKDQRSGPASFLGFVAGWPQMASRFESDTASYVTTVLRTLGTRTFLEGTVGVNWSHQYTAPFDQAALDANTRAKVLPALPRFFPDANPLDLLPNTMFESPAIPGVIGAFQYERRFPYWAFNTLWNVSGSVTRIAGAHTVKTGLFVEHTTRPVRQRSWFNGTLSFNVDSSHPLNTNTGFANALLGAVAFFQQADAQPVGNGRFVNTEAYVQDTWRIGRRVTLDAGVRVYLLTPTSNRGGRIAQFEPADFDPSRAPQLYAPISTPQGRRAVDPATGEVLPQVYIGRPVPGTGDLLNGMRLYDGTPHRTSPFVAAPRLAGAWDVGGDGRTAIRGGVGVFYDRYADNDVLELVELPPLVHTYTVKGTTLPELVGSPLTETPNAVRRFEPFVPPVVYNWSAGVQREVGRGVAGDLAYVGNAARHQVLTRELNGRPYGYAYQASNLDPSNVNGGQPQPLPEDLLRPYRGYASILQREFTGYADYHALQIALTRRRTAGWPSFGAAYTWQIVNKALGAIDPFVEDNRDRHYNAAGRRPHTLTVHYSWMVPRTDRAHPAVRALVDGWQISGVTSWIAGAQSGVSYSYTNIPTGALVGNGSIGGGPNRPRLLCDPALPRAERTFVRQFRTECVAAPDDPFNLGDAPGDELQGPGFVNWDIAVFRHVPLGGPRRLQLRVELYNAFDTRQWTSVYTNAQFDYATGALANPNVFGSLTGLTNSARRIQLGARFTF